jgi:CRP-like cAMP-binding protein
MNTASSFIAHINETVQLTEEEKQFISSICLPLTVRQGDFVERSGEVTRYYIYVQSGCLMTYFTDKDAVDHVAQFATARWWTGDLHSITKGIPSIYSTRALADSEVLLLSKHSQEELLEKYPRLERYFRILYQNALVTHLHRIIQGHSAAADERYISFREKYPSLEQYVPLKYIASYLGITPEFLSKVRRRLMEKG